MRQPRYEVLWYKKLETETVAEAMRNGDYETKSFYTRKSAMKFYEEHKNDTDKCGWWITHRNSDWEVIEDIVY